MCAKNWPMDVSIIIPNCCLTKRREEKDEEEQKDKRIETN